MHKRKTDTAKRRASIHPASDFSLAPVLEMYSQKELIIENVKSLEYYDENCVRVRTTRGFVTATGKSLAMRCLANGNIAVCGNMESIGFDDPS